MTRALILYVAIPGLALLSLLAGCAPEGSELAGATWMLVQEEQGGSSLLEGAEITLEFFRGEGVVHGTYGYHKYEGGYEVDGDSLTIIDVCFTTMACQAENGMDEEQAHIEKLMKAESYVIEGDTLTIHAGDEKLVFHAA